MAINEYTMNQWRSAWNGHFTEKNLSDLNQAISAFNEIEANPYAVNLTYKRIFRACLKAQTYDPDKDDGKKYRKNLANSRRTKKDLIKALRLLANAEDRNDPALFWATLGTENRIGVFRKIEGNLKKSLPELDGGPFFLRHILGNLHFPKAINVGRPVDKVTMLAFELTFYFRMLTAGKGGDLLASGSLLPEYGDPCSDKVALFCKLIFNEAFDGTQINDRLRKLPSGIRLIPWSTVQ